MPATCGDPHWTYKSAKKLSKKRSSAATFCTAIFLGVNLRRQGWWDGSTRHPFQLSILGEVFGNLDLKHVCRRGATIPLRRKQNQADDFRWRLFCTLLSWASSPEINPYSICFKLLYLFSLILINYIYFQTLYNNYTYVMDYIFRTQIRLFSLRTKTAAKRSAKPFSWLEVYWFFFSHTLQLCEDCSILRKTPRN